MLLTTGYKCVIMRGKEIHAMKHLAISLTAAGSFRLHFPDGHSVVIGTNPHCLPILVATIRDWTEEALIASKGSPIQAQINEALKGATWGPALQLAGARKRRAEIKAATGVTVRPGKKQLSLADLGL
jgi:hypothetical protein